MDTKILAVGLAMGLVVAVALGRAEASKIPWSGTFSGSGISTNIDTNRDGSKAGWDTDVINSNLGRFSSQDVGEVLPPPSAPVTCPQGNLEFPYLLISVVSTHEETGDQLFSELVSGTFCFDTATGAFSFSFVLSVTGGTGQFAGATGSLEATATGVDVVVGPKGQFFSHSTGEFTGTIITPD